MQIYYHTFVYMLVSGSVGTEHCSHYILPYITYTLIKKEESRKRENFVPCKRENLVLSPEAACLPNFFCNWM